ncbi:MAG: c-type cytochrome [Rhodospirillales bacterium]
MTKTIFFTAFLGFSVLCAGFPPHAAEAASGRELSEERCASCHGTRGVSANDLIPNLRCQKKKYLVRQLQRFQISGHGVKDLKDITPRSDLIMDEIAKSLTYGDIVKIANFYATEICRE